MRAYCNSASVVATHDDHQMVDPAVYGEGVDVVIVPDDYVFDRLGEWEPGPEESEADDPRPFARPALDLGEVLSLTVNDERARRVQAGAVITVDGAGDIPLQGREEDARNLQALGLAASLRIAVGDTATTTTFRDRDNALHELTPPQVLQLWQGGAAYIEAIYAASWAIKEMDPPPPSLADDGLWPAPVWPQPLDE